MRYRRVFHHQNTSRLFFTRYLFMLVYLTHASYASRFVFHAQETAIVDAKDLVLGTRFFESGNHNLNPFTILLVGNSGEK
jgi:hypothetical protein